LVLRVAGRGDVKRVSAETERDVRRRLRHKCHLHACRVGDWWENVAVQLRSRRRILDKSAIYDIELRRGQVTGDYRIAWLIVRLKIEVEIWLLNCTNKKLAGNLRWRTAGRSGRGRGGRDRRSGCR